MAVSEGFQGVSQEGMNVEFQEASRGEFQISFMEVLRAFHGVLHANKTVVITSFSKCTEYMLSEMMPYRDTSKVNY